MIAKTHRALFLLEYLDLAQATGVEWARWEHFQLSHLNDDSTFRIENKSRQIAWSWTIAAEGVADAILDRRDSIFVSINQEEAKEKIRYARHIIDALHPQVRPTLARDNELGLELHDGARLTSLPATPPRGRSRSNVFVDEFAHVRRDMVIYTAALPVISKGGRLRIGSSPLGASGRFWEIFEQKIRPYPGYKRKRTPWWHVYAFCTNVAEALKLAPALTTARRVELFGNDRIKAIYANMPEEDFRQEYETAFVDESTAWITWAEILSAQDSALACVMAEADERDPGRAREAIDQLAELARKGGVERNLVAGMDIGRTRNASELFVVGITTNRAFPLRLALTLQGMPFDEQIDILAYAMRQLPIVGILIDRNGLGMNLAENAEKMFPGRAAGVDFTNASKTIWATDAKVLIQRNRTPLPVDREIAYQIHSIKKTVSANRNLIFDTERNQKHHADKFWAWALALVLGVSMTAPEDSGLVVHEEHLEISPY